MDRALHRPQVRASPGPLLRNPAFAIVWAVYVVAGIADCLSTQMALRAGLRERNPLAAAVYSHTGILGLWMLKGLVLAAILGGLSLIPRRVALVFAGLLATTAVVNVQANIDALRALLG